MLFPFLILGGVVAAIAVASSGNRSAGIDSTPLPNNPQNPFPQLPNDVVNCDNEITKLPSAMQDALKTAAQTNVAAIGRVADAVDLAGFHDAATCIREMTKQVTANSPDKCAGLLNDVPEPARTIIRDTIANAGSSGELLGLAMTVDAQGFHDLADCIRQQASAKPSAVPGIPTGFPSSTDGAPGLPPWPAGLPKFPGELPIPKGGI